MVSHRTKAAFCAVAVAFVALSGCSGGSVTTAPSHANANVPAVPAFSVSATGAATASGGVLTVPFPSTSGFGGSLSLPVATLPANDTFAVVFSSTQPDGAAALDERRIQSVSTMTPIDYACIAFSGGFVSVSAPTFVFTLPGGFTSVSGTYYLAQRTAGEWNEAYAGPAAVAPGRVTFTGSGALTFTSGTPSCFGLYYLAPGAPAPAASGSPVAAVSPSPSPASSALPGASPSPGASTAPGASPSPAASGSPLPSPSASPVPAASPSALASASPVPSPSPSPSPMPGVLSASPTQLNIVGTGSANAQTIAVTEGGYTGAFGESDDCASAGYATVTSTGSPHGPSATFTVTGASAGECSVTFSDSFNQTTSVFVDVTTSGFVIESHPR